MPKGQNLSLTFPPCNAMATRAALVVTHILLTELRKQARGLPRHAITNSDHSQHVNLREDLFEWLRNRVLCPEGSGLLIPVSSPNELKRVAHLGDALMFYFLDTQAL